MSSLSIAILWPSVIVLPTKQAADFSPLQAIRAERRSGM